LPEKPLSCYRTILPGDAPFPKARKVMYPERTRLRAARFGSTACA